MDDVERDMGDIGNDALALGGGVIAGEVAEVGGYGVLQ